ncbi:MAG TPA: phosphatidylinositol kinase [Acidimicrobiales bacterium]|nr:phosphatidylinositol kinase [Acidimicrobiales bacterium]
MDEEQRRTLLGRGSIQIEGRVTGSSNQALLVTVRLDGQSTLACYKAEAGERPLWDFPDGLWRREVAAYELDVALGTGLVPTTVQRDDAPFGVGSLQWWIEADDEHYFTLREREEFSGWFAALAAFDAVANNADRKAGHVLFDGERCWAIDNGLCFHEHDKLRTVVWEYAGLAVPGELLDAIDRFALGDGANLGRWLSPAELERTLWRARRLARAGHYPTPDEDADWPPYPWPLI